MPLKQSIVGLKLSIRRWVDSRVSVRGQAARGNLATEDLVYALGSDELEGNIDIVKLVDTSWWLAEFTGHPHIRWYQMQYEACK